MCDARGTGIAAALAGLAALAGTVAPAESTEALKQELTPDYLEGEWCSTESRDGTREYYVFAPDGSYRYGHEEHGFEPVAEGALPQLLDAFRGVLAIEDDSFRAYYDPNWRVVFERGPCT